MDALRADGLAAIHALYPSLAQATAPAIEQFVGAGIRPDGRPFYLTIVAPDAALQKDAAWSGAFFAPCGFFHVAGSVEGRPYAADSSLLAVSAALILDGRETVAARWSVIGPSASVTAQNNEAMIQDITIAAKGPHDERDIRSCIARHAPLCAWGVPRTVVAAQCGVALACLIEAVC
jgi:hypothetical protein